MHVWIASILFSSSSCPIIYEYFLFPFTHEFVYVWGSTYWLFFLMQVYNFVKLPELYYAGSHGMDIRGPSKSQLKSKKVSTLCSSYNLFCINKFLKDPHIYIFCHVSCIFPLNNNRKALMWLLGWWRSPFPACKWIFAHDQWGEFICIIFFLQVPLETSIKVVTVFTISLASMQVYRALLNRTKSIPGAKVENNKFCLSVHYRNVDEKVKQWIWKWCPFEMFE